MSLLRSFGRGLLVGCLLFLALVALAQPSSYDVAMDQRDEAVDRLEHYEALLAPPGTLYVLDFERWLADPDGEGWNEVSWLSAEEVAVRLLQRHAGSDAAVLAREMRSLLLYHLRIQSFIETQVAALRAEVALLDDVVIDALAREGPPSTFDWDLTGTWHAEVDEGWELANLDDMRATLTVPSLAEHDLPTLTLRIENFHFVPGWNATISLRPRVRDVQAMLDGGGLHTIYPVGEFAGPLGPRSLAPEDTEPADREDHHCQAWDEPGGIGRITIVDPGGADERLELTLRFEAVHCDDGVPVDVFLTFER